MVAVGGPLRLARSAATKTPQVRLQVGGADTRHGRAAQLGVGQSPRTTSKGVLADASSVARRIAGRWGRRVIRRRRWARRGHCSANRTDRPAGQCTYRGAVPATG